MLSDFKTEHAYFLTLLWIIQMVLVVWASATDFYIHLAALLGLDALSTQMHTSNGWPRQLLVDKLISTSPRISKGLAWDPLGGGVKFQMWQENKPQQASTFQAVDGIIFADFPMAIV